MPSPAPILSQLRPAERLLLEACKSGQLDPDHPFFAEPGEALGLTREVGQLSVRHAVQGLVFLNLYRSLPEEPLWNEARNEIRQSLSLAKRQAAFCDLEQDRVLRGLNRAGFQPLVLKGGALRRRVFRFPVERAMGDLDILVLPGEVPEVIETLGSLGYRSTYSEAARSGFREHLYHDRVTHPNGFHVEVHWALTRPGALTPLDPELFQQRACTMEGPGSTEIRVPSSEDMVLHTVSQSEQDGIQRLRRLVDLDRLLISQDLDWAYIHAEAGRSGMSTSLAVALRLANLLLGTPVPSDLQEGRGVPVPTRRAIAIMRPVRRLLREPRRALVPDRCLFRLWCLRGSDARRAWITTMASGAVDPLKWVWEEADESEASSGSWMEGSWLLLKILALQLAILGAALASVVRRNAREELHFWKALPT